MTTSKSAGVAKTLFKRTNLTPARYDENENKYASGWSKFSKKS